MTELRRRCFDSEIEPSGVLPILFNGEAVLGGWSVIRSSTSVAMLGSMVDLVLPVVLLRLSDGRSSVLESVFVLLCCLLVARGRRSVCEPGIALAYGITGTGELYNRLGSTLPDMLAMRMGVLSFDATILRCTV